MIKKYLYHRNEPDYTTVSELDATSGDLKTYNTFEDHKFGEDNRNIFKVW
jgi:hypothetical protein